MTDTQILCLLLAVAFVSNLLSALSGGGAGLIQLPILILLGLPFPIALATHKVASVALGAGAITRHWRSTPIDWPICLLVMGCGLPGVIAGASVILQTPPVAAQLTLALLTVALGLYSAVRHTPPQTITPEKLSRTKFLIGGVILCFLGFLNGSLTSGTGLFVTLWLVRWFKLDFTRAIAYTLIMVGLGWNGAGAITLGLLGHIHWPWIPALLVGSITGGYAGAHLSLTLSNTFVKRCFELTTILTGISLFAKAVYN